MKYSEFLRLLKKDGWYILRVEGSHHVMAHPIKKGTLTIPVHGSKEIGKGLAIKILKAAGLR